jgi:hypothetical protein
MTLWDRKPQNEAQFVMGNQAIARGALEAGVQFAAGYPGTPSSEIIENLSEAARSMNIHAEWSANEKVAAEGAAAAAFAGLRSLVAMKNAGLSVALDFLTHLSKTKAVLFAEEVDPFLEHQVKEMLADRPVPGLKMFGKGSGHIPSFGEITPDRVIQAVSRILKTRYQVGSASYRKKLSDLYLGPSHPPWSYVVPWMSPPRQLLGDRQGDQGGRQEWVCDGRYRMLYAGCLSRGKGADEYPPRYGVGDGTGSRFRTIGTVRLQPASPQHLRRFHLLSRSRSGPDKRGAQSVQHGTHHPRQRCNGYDRLPVSSRNRF